MTEKLTEYSYYTSNGCSTLFNVINIQSEDKDYYEIIGGFVTNTGKHIELPTTYNIKKEVIRHWTKINVDF